jgi:hypothetical protein
VVAAIENLKAHDALKIHGLTLWERWVVAKKVEIQ